VNTTLVFVNGVYDPHLSTLSSTNTHTPETSSKDDEYRVRVEDGRVSVITSLKVALLQQLQQQQRQHQTIVINTKDKAANNSNSDSDGNGDTEWTVNDYLSLMTNSQHIPELRELPRDSYGSKSLCALNLVLNS
jgi:hypothetical protein